MRQIFFGLFMVLAVCRAGESPEGVRHVNAEPEDIVTLNTATFEYSSIVLPVPEKVVTFACGDSKHWDVQFIEGAEGFLLVKPAPGAHPTTIQILTDHNRNWSIKANIAQPGTPIDIKLFLDDPNDREALRKPPSFVPATEALRAKAEAQQAQAELARIKRQSESQVRAQEDQYRASYPQKLNFDYTFRRDEAPFHVHAVFHDEKFTYIAAQPEEVASFYELKDGKPNLVELRYQNGVYVVRDIVDRGFLQVGKKRTEIVRKPNS